MSNGLSPEAQERVALRTATLEVRWRYSIELMKTFFAGLKDLALVGVSLYTIQVQYANAGKLDKVEQHATIAAEESAAAKSALAASVRERREQMQELGAKIDASPMNAAAAPPP